MFKNGKSYSKFRVQSARRKFLTSRKSISSARPGWGCCASIASRSMSWTLLTASVRSRSVGRLRMWSRMSTDRSIPKAALFVSQLKPRILEEGDFIPHLGEHVVLWQASQNSLARISYRMRHRWRRLRIELTTAYHQRQRQSHVALAHRNLHSRPFSKARTCAAAEAA
jgi:hypothetical protein